MDDVIETSNHFRCIDLIIDRAASTLSEHFIKKLHHILKTSTSDSRKDWFAVGEYKRLPNEVGGMQTSLPEEVVDKMKLCYLTITPFLKRHWTIFWIFTCALSVSTHFKTATAALDGLSCSRNVSNTTSFRLS